MIEISLEKVNLSQAANLLAIGIKTFKESFAAANTPENMEHYLAKSFTLAKMESELIDPNTIIYFAKKEEQIIGYLKLNLGDKQTEQLGKKALEIERIYVLKDYHGMAVGQKLYEKAIEIAKEIQVKFVWLGVWEHNPRAIKFYRKNGFTQFDKHIFYLGNDAQTDLMLKLKL